MLTWTLYFIGIDELKIREKRDEIKSFACTCNQADMPDVKINSVIGATPMEKTLDYKYILDVDGNSVSWTRLPYIMAGGSVALKVDSNYGQWFYG